MNITDIIDSHVKKSINQYIKNEVLWDKVVNEYGVTVSLNLIGEDGLAKVKRKDVALAFWESNLFVQGQCEKSAMTSKMSREDTKQKFLDILAREIDYRLVIAYAQTYTNSDVTATVDNFILKGNFKFKYKANYLRLEDSIARRAEKKEVKITKAQVVYLDNLLLRESAQLQKPVKSLSRDTATLLILHLSAGQTIDENISSMIYYV